MNDNSPETGGTFTFSAMIRNVGDGDAAATTLRYYRSTDAYGHQLRHRGRHGRGAGAVGWGNKCGIDRSDGAIDGWHVLLRRVCGRGGRRVGHDEQLLGIGRGYGRGAYAGLGGAGARCEGQRGDGRGVLAIGYGDQPGRWAVGGDNGAVPPLDGRDDHDIRHVGGHGRGASACPSARLRGNDSFDGAIHGWHVLLRRVRGRGARGIRHDEQLLGISAGRCVGASGEDIALTLPSSVGTYYYGACVEVVAGELDTTNNCSGSVAITVQQP